ncbi:response regulator transcription factor [Marinimicrobium alkaliphilum]|uniref:response regulator transcription factor n=1 Tax=Marinimicrobium alkaliphilum TaxID=2202654 RepID=UPI000DB9E106|nr:response regulator transcription factor [Marinimicrobium alkaliphilum]
MARVLLIEDDVSLSRGIVASLSGHGFAIDPAFDGKMGLTMASDQPYAIIIIDIGLPDISGFKVLDRLRASGNATPILILTARDAIEDRIQGLDRGADDYLLKPFETGELAARLRALLRRPQGDPTPSLKIGNLVFDRSHGTVHVNDRLIELRHREWLVLERLIVNAGKVVSNDRLTAEVFNFNDSVSPNAIQLYIARLRKKLAPDGPRIRTLRGLGYLLEEE